MLNSHCLKNLLIIVALCHIKCNAQANIHSQGTRKCPQIKNPAKVFIAAIILTHIYQQQPQRAEVYKVEISWT